MGSDEDTTVLIVDNEPDIVETYRHWLQDRYRVKTASSGEEALEEITPDLDVLLLDRKMPGMSGNDILNEIKGNNELKCRIAMVTAVSPDFDIINMGFDDYLVKPVSKEEIVQVVERLMERKNYNEKCQRLFSSVSKKLVLEKEMSENQLHENDEYNDLVEEIDRLEKETRSFMDKMTSRDFKAVMRDLA